MKRLINTLLLTLVFAVALDSCVKHSNDSQTSIPSSTIPGPTGSRQPSSLLPYVTDGPVYAIAVGGDGTTFIGGAFTQVGPIVGGGARLDAETGQIEPAILKINGTVQAVVSDDTGGWYIAGNFDSVGGIKRKCIAHILADGGVDPAWDPNSSDIEVPNEYYAIDALALSGNTLFVAGDFFHIGGQERTGIAAVNATSGTVTDWNAQSDGMVHALAVSGSRIYAGGWFKNMGGQIRKNLASFDVTTGLVTDWDPNKDTDVTVYYGGVFTIAPGGNTVYVAGPFTRMGGLARPGLAAIDADTGAIFNWDPNPNSRVNAIAVHENAVYIGGSFSQIGGQARNGVAAVDISTGTTLSWDPDVKYGSYTACVSAITISNNIVYIGGSFAAVGTQSRNNVAALDISTGAAGAWDPNANGAVSALAVSGSTVFVGGSFTSIAGVKRNHLAAFDKNWILTAWDPQADNTVRALALSGGTVYAGGEFTVIGQNNQTRNRLAAVDVSGNALSWNPDADNIVYTVIVSQNLVFAGGGFSSVGGQARKNIAAIDGSSGTVTAWNPGVDGPVYALAASGGIMYVGGDFNSIGGQVRNNIAAVDIASGLATPWNPSATGDVHEGIYQHNAFVGTIVIDGNIVFLGGFFNTVGASYRNNLAAVDSSNAIATVWQPEADYDVNAIALSGQTLYVGGRFQNLAGQPRSALGAVNAATGTASDWDPNAYIVSNLTPVIQSLAVNGDAVCVGGTFSHLGPEPNSYIACLGP